MELLKRALALIVGLAIAAGVAESFIRVVAIVRYDVKYLATADVNKIPTEHASSFEDFLGEFKVHLVPHRIWQNYFANSLGFTDREFSIEKPKGTMRIMGLGDSFLYGMVAYPQNVLTLVGASLRAECPGESFETMNFGIPATGVWEYRLMHKFAAPIYKPGMVVTHFYMGNDGPDLVFEAAARGVRGRIKSVLKTSYAWNYLFNSIKVLRSATSASTAPASGPAPAHGGERVTDRPDFTDNEFTSLTKQDFAKAEAAELGRLYRGGKSVSPAEVWKDTIGVLDMLRTEVIASTGRAPILVLYPSALQVYPERFAAARRALVMRHPSVDPADFDPLFPNGVVKEYCRRAGLSCYDVTDAMLAAAAENHEPLYLPQDTHWGVRGNRVAAAAEAAFLRQELCINVKR
ncbi:MAG: hypothetical protein WA592_10695 [Pseudolabrys sp.]|jgi:hypothetical protein